RDSLRAAAPAAPDRHLYYGSDWHLNPEGNRALARFVHGELERRGVLPAAPRSADLPPRTAPEGLPGWLALFAALWIVLSAGWALTYRGDPLWQAPLKVGLMLALIFGIAIGGSAALRALPSSLASAL